MEPSALQGTSSAEQLIIRYARVHALRRARATSSCTRRLCMPHGSCEAACSGARTIMCTCNKVRGKTRKYANFGVGVGVEDFETFTVFWLECESWPRQPTKLGECGSQRASHDLFGTAESSILTRYFGQGSHAVVPLSSCARLCRQGPCRTPSHRFGYLQTTPLLYSHAAEQVNATMCSISKVGGNRA